MTDSASSTDADERENGVVEQEISDNEPSKETNRWTTNGFSTKQPRSQNRERVSPISIQSEGSAKTVEANGCGRCSTKTSASNAEASQPRLLTDGGTEQDGHDPASGEVDRWECGDCGGDLTMVDSLSNDTSGTECYECVDCGASGSVYWAPGVTAKTCGSVVSQ